MATIKQKKALKKVVENGGNVTQAMKDVGYAPATINNPSVLTKSKGWQELMDKHLPDIDVAKVHKRLLKKEEVIVVSDGKDGSHLEWTGQPHSDAMKAVDTAYKLRGHYAAEKSVVVNVDVTELKQQIQQQLHDFRSHN